MNILVTGANGQLGHEMQRVAKNSQHTFIFTDVAEGYKKQHEKENDNCAQNCAPAAAIVVIFH